MCILCGFLIHVEGGRRGVDLLGVEVFLFFLFDDLLICSFIDSLFFRCLLYQVMRSLDKF